MLYLIICSKTVIQIASDMNAAWGQVWVRERKRAEKGQNIEEHKLIKAKSKEQMLFQLMFECL